VSHGIFLKNVFSPIICNWICVVFRALPPFTYFRNGLIFNE